MAVFSSTITSIQDKMHALNGISGIRDMIAHSRSDKTASPLTTDTENSAAVNATLAASTANKARELAAIETMVDTILVQRDLAANVEVLKVTLNTEQVLTRQPVVGSYGKTQQQP